MTRAPVSVIVVSRDRPAALARCLTGLSQLRYDPFEVIVVADPAGITAAQSHAMAEHLKLVPFDLANISGARNAGIVQAAGEIVAFVDDDAVPEPNWLWHLAAAFELPNVSAAGGYVRGRNGISYQWRAQSIDTRGETNALPMSGMDTVALQPAEGQAIKTEGTNMAVRRSVLAELGGFDPAYRFYMDETDLNLRLATAGHATAIVPLAQVHHGYMASATRRDDRAPRDLFEIGASFSVFLRRFCPAEERPARFKAFRIEQKQRLLRHMVAGRMEPRDVRRLMAGLEGGFREGETRSMAMPAPLSDGNAPFKRVPSKTIRPHNVISGRSWSLAKMQQAARSMVNDGAIVSLFAFSPTTLRHRVSFKNGVWEQRGGLFGKSDRKDRAVQLTTFARRLRAETDRISTYRDPPQE